MSLWNWIRGRVDQKAAHYTMKFIEEPDAPPLAANESYFRIWLSEMFLAKSREWGSDEFPSTTTAVRLTFGDHDSVTLSHVAQAPQDALSRAVLVNYAATPLLPFRGGVVELEGALVALKGENQLRAAIDVLGDFAGMIAPPVAQALNVAGRVADGVEKVLNAGQSDVHLGLHQAFADHAGGGHNVLRAGYIAVVLGTGQELSDSLRVVEGRLHQATNGATSPLDGYDYLLYRVEGRIERDDWLLRDIQQPMNQAIEALLKGEEESAKAYERVALAAALTSPDLAVPDRRRVAQAVKDEIAAIRQLGLGAVPEERRDLNGVMAARDMGLAQARALGPLHLEEVVAGG